MIAYCEDYERRKRFLACNHCNKDVETRQFYSYLNRVIDMSLEVTLDGLDIKEREAMRRDIGNRRGAKYSQLYQIAPTTYKRYKRHVKYVIAKSLGLLPEE